MTGYVSYRAGLAAEDAVERFYADAGQVVCERRWRGKSGEIDLIARQGNSVIFIEVKKASSHAVAAERLSRAQMTRICRAATEFLAGEPRGQDTDCRFDVALVDAVGQVEILENAFAA
jgi:putative endonuclease